MTTGPAAGIATRLRQALDSGTRRLAEQKRLAQARAVQEEASAAAERKSADEARTHRHAQRVARSIETLRNSSHSMLLCDAAVDLGHSGAREAIPDLAAFLDRKLVSVDIRNCAAGALVRLGETERALAFYLECARAGTSDARGVAFFGFRKLGPSVADVAIPHLSEALRSPGPNTRYQAVDALAHMGPAAEPYLREAVQDSDERVRQRATEALGSLQR